MHMSVNPHYPSHIQPLLAWLCRIDSAKAFQEST